MMISAISFCNIAKGKSFFCKAFIGFAFIIGNLAPQSAGYSNWLSFHNSSISYLFVWGKS